MLKICEHGEVVELRMDRPPANALNTRMVQRIAAAHSEACEQGARAIILSGREGMFSAGLDVPELIELDRPAMHEFWGAFIGLTRALAASPVPVVAALSGHSPAGGTVLAIHCDYRIGAEGRFKIGLNEVQVGLPVPSAILFAYERLVGGRLAQQYAMSGRLMPMEEACQAGLVDELCAPQALLERALEWCGALLELPPVAMNRTRLLSKARLLEIMDAADDVEVVTGYWFSPETQAAMRRLIDQLGGK